MPNRCHTYAFCPNLTAAYAGDTAALMDDAGHRRGVFALPDVQHIAVGTVIAGIPTIRHTYRLISGPPR